MEFRAGRAFATSLSVFVRRLPTLLVLGVLVQSPILLHQYLLFRSDSFAQSSLGWSLLGAVLTLLLSAAVVFVVVEHLRDQPAGIGKAVKVLASCLFPVVGVVLVFSLAAMGAAVPAFILTFAFKSWIGTVVGLIPVFIVMMIFYVVVPVAVIERPGVMMSLRRSQELTEGHRWGLFALFIVTLGLFFVLLTILTWALGHGSLGLAPYLVIVTTVQMLFYVYSSVLTGVVYHDLRVEKDGVSVDELASVFD